MFDLIQLTGYTRNAILTISPIYVTKNLKTNTFSVMKNAPCSTPVILPEGMRVRKMGWLRYLIHPTAMMSPSKVLLLNPDQPFLLAEIVVHELVHYFQRMRMGWTSYILTYLLQFPNAIWKSIQNHGTWHDYHLMECESRHVAMQVIENHFYDSTGRYLLEREAMPLDAEREIRNIQNW